MDRQSALRMAEVAAAMELAATLRGGRDRGSRRTRQKVARAVTLLDKLAAQCPADQHPRGLMVVHAAAGPGDLAALRHRAPIGQDATARRPKPAERGLAEVDPMEPKRPLVRVRNRKSRVAGRRARTVGLKPADRRSSRQKTILAAGSTTTLTPAAPEIDAHHCQADALSFGIPMAEPSEPIPAAK